MDNREQQEARTLGGALKAGQEQQAHDYLLNVVLQEPHALQIITGANRAAGPNKAETIGVYDHSGRVVLVPADRSREVPVGQLTPAQMAATDAAPPVVAAPAPATPRLTEGDALGAALKVGDSDQVSKIMQNVVTEPNAIGIIQHANTVAGDNPAENIGVGKDGSVTLVTNADGKQYSLGTLAPEAPAAPAAPARPVAEGDALGAALKSGDSDTVQSIMQNVLKEQSALNIIKHANSVAGQAAENIGIDPDSHAVFLVTNNDNKQYQLGSLTDDQLQPKRAAAPPPPADVPDPAPIAAPAPRAEYAPPPPMLGPGFPGPAVSLGIDIPLFGGRPHRGYYDHRGWGGPRPGIGIGLDVSGILGALAGPRY